MENGVKFLNGGLRRSSSGEEEGIVPVLVNGDGDIVDGDEGSKSPSGKIAMHEAPGDRIKYKAKRLTKGLSKEGVNGGVTLPVSRYLKNSRKPRNGFGRGLPKKGNFSW